MKNTSPSHPPSVGFSTENPRQGRFVQTRYAYVDPSTLCVHQSVPSGSWLRHCGWSGVVGKLLFLAYMYAAGGIANT